MRIFAVLMCLLLVGCKTTNPVETIADGAKETISDIYQSLPKECQSKQTKVESVKANCTSQMEILEEKIKQRNLLIAFLSLLVIFLFARKVRSILLKTV